MKTEKRTSFSIFASVIRALFLREIQTRFGTKKFGYIWALVDALSQIIVFSVIKTLISDSAMPQIDFPVFLATSFLAYNFFRDIVKKSMDAFDANSALFVYKQVKPIDTVIARVLVELVVLVAATAVLVGLGAYLGFDMAVENINMVLFAFAWIGLFGLSLGLFFAVVIVYFPNFGRVVNLLFTPLFFLSALFYTMASLPPVAREVLFYNPVVHFIEMIHGFYFSTLNTDFVDYSYMTAWTLLPLFLGLWLYRHSEKRIIAS
ncbi:ABC transporter permease [Sulfurimonas sp. HSL3-7]|uniref:ABC transporter permease n=1 Tax=Sulfonitrofixus jiaomeiensis TaxID=3131938 RepID=UPI0031F8E2D5